MNTGFKDLDKIINIEESQLILLTGTYFIEEFSGDIANNVCLKQECEVLEIVRCRKEYMIQRMFVNEANVDYRKWYHKNQYTDEELKRIGQSIVNIIEGTIRLPTIIEQDVNLYKLKKVAKLVSDFANHYADKEIVNTLIIIDVFPLGDKLKYCNKKRDYKRNTRESLRLIKNLKKISSKLKCPIIFIDNIDLNKKFNTENYTCNYLTKEHIDKIKKINKYVDKFIILNADETKHIKTINIFDVDVYDRQEKIGSCKLKYDFNCRRFTDYK